MAAVFGRERQQVDTVEVGRATRDGERRISGQHTRECRLSRPVGAHYGMHLPGAYGEVDTLEDFLLLYSRAEVFHLQQYLVAHKLVCFLDWSVLVNMFHGGLCQPTDPSRVICSSLWASTANSIGSLFITSLA